MTALGVNEGGSLQPTTFYLGPWLFWPQRRRHLVSDPATSKKSITIERCDSKNIGLLPCYRQLVSKIPWLQSLSTLAGMSRGETCLQICTRMGFSDSSDDTPMPTQLDKADQNTHFVTISWRNREHHLSCPTQEPPSPLSWLTLWLQRLKRMLVSRPRSGRLRS